MIGNSDFEFNCYAFVLAKINGKNCWHDKPLTMAIGKYFHK